MKNRDAFSAFHPAVLCGYYALVLVFSMFLTHPLCLVASLLGALSYAAKLRGGRAVLRSLAWMAPVWLLAAAVNTLFNHEGATILTYFSSGNPLTLESMLYGLVCGRDACGGAALVHNVSGRNDVGQICLSLWPRRSRAESGAVDDAALVPKFRAQLRAVQQARQFAGNSEKNGPIQKARTSVENFSILVTWSLENAVETADSMRARGYGLPGRTAFSIFRFETRDARLLAWLLACGGLVIFGWASGALAWRYYPTVRGGFTGLTALCAAAELALALTPWATDAWEARKWNS